ncbi:phosphotransferase [Dyadobacter flavalbus]|uniref:Phosphotransferase n=1 Tax=Dyadobacter flavalbus TaxID=2579942 RepID=A0A5M8QLG5_9BACT|nr:phosphotransferase [Dyadobacter flavalbus]KAA6437047.1 phosphotransferase [Dyadobacter flavalbus]
MAHFPVTNSNLSAEHLGLFIQTKYALGKNTRCRLIRAGINDTYLVNDDLQQFVFRVYSAGWRTRIEIEEELNLLNLLRVNQISVSYPVADHADNFIQILNAPEGDRFAVLFSYAKGEKLHDVPAETHYKIGQLIGRFHEITLNRTLKRVHYTPEIVLVDALKKLELFLPPETAEMQFMKSMQKYLLHEFSKVNGDTIRNGIVHLDIWFDNLNVTDKNEITIFDFDFCGNGWLCFDIAYYVMQLHNIEKYEAKDYTPKIENFFSGYESVTKISTNEKALVPVLGLSLYFFYLGVQCERFENYSNVFLNENYLKRFINGLVKRYYEITKVA